MNRAAAASDRSRLPAGRRKMSRAKDGGGAAGDAEVAAESGEKRGIGRPRMNGVSRIARSPSRPALPSPPAPGPPRSPAPASPVRPGRSAKASWRPSWRCSCCCCSSRREREGRGAPVAERDLALLCPQVGKGSLPPTPPLARLRATRLVSSLPRGCCPDPWKRRSWIEALVCSFLMGGAGFLIYFLKLVFLKSAPKS